MSGFPFPGRGAASLAASPPPNPRSSICRLQKLPILSTGLEPYLTCVCDLVPPEWELSQPGVVPNQLPPPDTLRASTVPVRGGHCLRPGPAPPTPELGQPGAGTSPPKRREEAQW